MSNPFHLAIRGGAVVDGSGAEPRPADVGVVGDRIVAVGELSGSGADTQLDATSCLVFPGFIDAHSHADALLGNPRVQEAYLRQGVTSVILGQDGVSFAPTQPEELRFVERYFAAIDGPAPDGYAHGGSVGALLATFEGSGAINAGYLVPAGVVRASVVGFDNRPATDAEIASMQEILASAMADGALGLSTGLDYVPGRFADAVELAAVCTPVAGAGGVYVSHMRGYSSASAPAALAEVATIAAAAGVTAHVSHLHGDAALIEEQLAGIERETGVALGFDSYPYLRGNTIVAMIALPADIQSGGIDATLGRLADRRVRARLREDWFPKQDRIQTITLSYVQAEEYRWAEGLRLLDAAAESGRDLADFLCDCLIASDLAVGCIVSNGADRTQDDMRRLLRHPRQVASSDAIFLGTHPHPRGWGAFSRLLGRHVRELGDWSWGQAAHHMSGATAQRFGLGDRGMIKPGAIADLVVIDPETVADRADYANPTQLAVGVSDVVVAGHLALHGGRITGARPARALRRTRSMDE